jgi:hypothetical protein
LTAIRTTTITARFCRAAVTDLASTTKASVAGRTRRRTYGHENQKELKVTITLRNKAEAIRISNAAERAMDHFGNGTDTMNGLRRLVNHLCDAIDKVK